MSPYVEIGGRYTSGLGIGREDLFWKLGLIFDVNDPTLSKKQKGEI